MQAPVKESVQAEAPVAAGKKSRKGVAKTGERGGQGNARAGNILGVQRGKRKFK